MGTRTWKFLPTYLSLLLLLLHVLSCSVAQAVLGIGPPAGLPQLQVPQLDTAYPSDQNHSPLELMMQQQQQGLTPAQSASALDRAASSNTSFGSSGPGGQDQQVQQGPPAAAAVGSDAAPTSSSSGPLEPSPKQQQLVSPTALPMPRMSNAFARKHGLDPKEHPLVNLQRLAMQQMSPSAAAMVGVCWARCSVAAVLSRLAASRQPQCLSVAAAGLMSHCCLL
jgi:hypothetical protein